MHDRERVTSTPTTRCTTSPIDRRVSRLRPLLALVLAVVALPLTARATSEAAPQIIQADSSWTLEDLLRLDGDQVVLVPDGEYTGMSVSAPHRETDGPLGGWLVLVAETPYEVVVSGELELAEDTSRVMFVGFKFDQARVFNFGQQIRYWHTDHVHPDVDWWAADRPIPRSFFIRRPAADIGVYGSDFHDAVASPINMSGSDRIEFAGIKVFDLSEPPGSDPQDLSHLNTISLLGGNVNDLTIRDSVLEGARANHQTDNGDVNGIRYENVWYSGAFGAAFQFNATNGNSITQSSRTDVRSFDHIGNNPRDRLDIVDGRQSEPGERPDRVDVADIRVTQQAPPTGTTDPATEWREANPFESWPAYFGWPSLDPVPPPPTEESDDRLWFVLAGAAGLLILWTGYQILRRKA